MTGLSQAIQEQAARGAAVVGICGGYQMLGRVIRDPEQIESTDEVVPGLRLLPVETVFVAKKATHQVRALVRGGPGWLESAAGQMVAGYEIHMGRTRGNNPWLTITERGQCLADEADGAVSHGGRVWGCYLHGLFENRGFRRAWLRGLGWNTCDALDGSTAGLTARLDRLANEVEQALNMALLERIVWGN